MVVLILYVLFAGILVALDAKRFWDGVKKCKSMRRELIVYCVFFAAATALAIMYLRDPFQDSIIFRLRSLLSL